MPVTLLELEVVATGGKWQSAPLPEGLLVALLQLSCRSIMPGRAIAVRTSPQRGCIRRTRRAILPGFSDASNKYGGPIFLGYIFF